MKHGSRYVPISPAREAMRKAIGAASYLHDFLVARQTDADGRVFYGRAITYRWILANWGGDPPAIRSLRRYISRLKRAGLLEVRIVGEHHGMQIRLVGSVKWPEEIPPPAVQLSLFAPAPIPIRQPATVGKDVEKVSETGGNREDGEKARGQKWPSA
jgi:hypothetical protein